MSSAQLNFPKAASDLFGARGCPTLTKSQGFLLVRAKY